MARAFDAVADAWEVATDALLEVGWTETAQGTASMGRAGRWIARSMRREPYVVVQGLVRDPDDPLVEAWSNGDKPGSTTSDLRIGLRVLAKHIRETVPAQSLGLTQSGRRLRLFLDPDSDAELIDVVDIYGNRRALQALVRVLHRGTGAERDPPRRCRRTRPTRKMVR